MRGLGARCLLGAAVIIPLVLGACDDGRAARAEEAAKWLRAYTKSHPPNQVWRATRVYGSDKGNVVMEVLVLSPKQAARLPFRPFDEDAGPFVGQTFYGKCSVTGHDPARGSMVLQLILRHARASISAERPRSARIDDLREIWFSAIPRP